MPLLELAQEQELYFRAEREKEVEFDVTLEESERQLTLTLSRFDASSAIVSARLALEGGETEEIKVEEAQALISPEARKQWRDNDIDEAFERESETQEAEREPAWIAQARQDYMEAEPASAQDIRDKIARQQTNRPLGLEPETHYSNQVSGQGRTVDRVTIFSPEDRVSPEQKRDAYAPAERGGQAAEAYFNLEEIRHNIVTGAANYDRSDPVVSAAARNYFAGQTDAYNAMRSSMIRDVPELEKVLPMEINRDAILAPEIAEERDRAHEQPAQSLAIG